MSQFRWHWFLINLERSVRVRSFDTPVYLTHRDNCYYKKFSQESFNYKNPKGRTMVGLNNEKLPKHLVISIDGNISSGKSTLVSNLSKAITKLNYQVESIPEPLEKWCNLKGHNLLGLFYQDSTRNNFVFQHYVQLTRLMDLRKVKTSPINAEDGSQGKISILERSLQNNRYCFNELAQRNGKLHPAEFSVLSAWHEWLDEHLDLSFDILIYLKTSPEVAYQRMQSRGRHEEDSVPLEYLSHLHEAYEDWLVRKTVKMDDKKHIPVIVVNADDTKEKVAEEATLKLTEFMKLNDCLP